MSNNPDSDEWDERYEAVREATEEDLKEEMHMQTVYFWRERFDTKTWHMGYWNSYGNGFDHYTTIASFVDDGLTDTFGTELLNYLISKWDKSHNPVAVQMGWLP